MVGIFGMKFIPFSQSGMHLGIVCAIFRLFVGAEAQTWHAVSWYSPWTRNCPLPIGLEPALLRHKNIGDHFDRCICVKPICIEQQTGKKKYTKQKHKNKIYKIMNLHVDGIVRAHEANYVVQQNDGNKNKINHPCIRSTAYTLHLPLAVARNLFIAQKIWSKPHNKWWTIQYPDKIRFRTWTLPTDLQTQNRQFNCIENGFTSFPIIR